MKAESTKESGNLFGSLHLGLDERYGKKNSEIEIASARESKRR